MDVFTSADDAREAMRRKAAADQDMLKRLYATTDAGVWAEEFCKIAWKLGHVLDEDWVRGWFANAIETARAEGANRPEQAAGD